MKALNATIKYRKSQSQKCTNLPDFSLTFVIFCDFHQPLFNSLIFPGFPGGSSPYVYQIGRPCVIHYRATAAML